MSHGTKTVGEPGQFEVSSKIKTICAILMFVGAAAFVVQLINDPVQAWYSYLIGFFYFMSLALGGLFFTSIQHMTKAGWSVNIRRFCESFSSFLPVGTIFAVVFVIGAPAIYEWLHPEVVAKDPLLQHKAPYLNYTFFLIRMGVFFGLWMLFKKLIVGASLKQDETGDVSITHSLVGKSIAFIAVFALSYSFFSVDTLMSLQPHWFSTIFGVYTFAGLFQSTIAMMILFIIYCMKKGWLTGYVDENHLHDLGKFLFAFTVFWAYIAFSQYMLIWYANLPEETGFIITRSQGAWLPVSIMLILFKFIVPFLALLPRWAKRTPVHLGTVAVLILIMQIVDIVWLSYPNMHAHDLQNFTAEHTHYGIMDLLVFCGFLGAFLFTVTRFLSKHSLIPVKDPRISESNHHHVVY